MKVVIIGRPNVGKSTLFNRLFGRRRALVHNLPGVTRDRIEEKTQWVLGDKTIPVLLVDTGGIGGEVFDREIREQVSLALAEADVALVVFDAQNGIVPQDQDVLEQIRRSGLNRKIPVIGVVNKIDTSGHLGLSSEFYSAGLEQIIPVSAEHNRGIETLIEAIVALQKKKDESSTEGNEADDGLIRVAIVGKPNVGKSTLLNALAGEERMITSPIAGTTIDSIDSFIEIDGESFVFIDTAGIRKKNKTEQGVEVLSVVQSRKAIERASVAILVIDGEYGPTDQDEKIAGIIEEVGCGVILAMNKWDLHSSKPGFTEQDAADRLRETMRFLSYAPLVFISAKKKTGFGRFASLIKEIVEQRQIKISTHELTEWVRVESEIHNPHGAKFYLCQQAGKNPPTFVCHVNDPDKVDFSLRRHLVNSIRERWGYMGSPIRLLVVKSENQSKRPTK